MQSYLAENHSGHVEVELHWEIAWGAGPIDGMFQYRDGDLNDILGVCLGVLKNTTQQQQVSGTLIGTPFTSGKKRTRATKLRGCTVLCQRIRRFHKIHRS